MEVSLKDHIAAVRMDIGQVLGRVEETEGRLDDQEKRLEDISKQRNYLHSANRGLRYKLEDYENCSRRKNLRIKGAPEKYRREELMTIVQHLFNPFLEKELTEPLKLDRVHRIARYTTHRSESPRDVIVRFHYAEEKYKIMEKLWNSPGVGYEGVELQVFADLSPETLLRRRLLKPLTELMRSSEITYQWGFPACLIGRKNGRSAVLRFLEDLGDFCSKLDILHPHIQGWSEGEGIVHPPKEVEMGWGWERALASGEGWCPR